jgi:glycosyltransferase involved in cell wall biosynthesis
MAITGSSDILVVGSKNKQELLNYYNIADFLVLPSFNEGFGHVLIESLACGTPVIGLDFHKNAINEIIIDNTNGVISECCSSMKLVQALDVAYKKNSYFHTIRKIISTNTHKMYNWKKLASRLLIEENN